MPKPQPVLLELAGREVRVTNPDKPWFPAELAGDAPITKLEIARYYVAVAEGAIRGVAGRPMQLERYVNGAGAQPFYQKRAPTSRPDWVEVVTLRFPSMRTADEIVVRDAAQLLWVVNLGCLALHPHPVRASDLDHPDELRIDLDPIPGVPWSQVRDVALTSREVLAELGLRAWPKTSGGRGMHLLVRIQPRWTFPEVRRAALGVAREVEQRMPGLATSRWWKEERVGVFLDYNQNAKDRTVASAYSVRAKPGAPVSAPLTWDEVPTCASGDYTVRTMPERYAALGDLHAGIDDDAGDLGPLLALAQAHEDAQGEAPLPPHYRKAPGEPKRIAPSRAAKPKPKPKTGRRVPTKPTVIVAESEDEDAALAGLERWKDAHPEAAAKLEPHHVLVDKMRGRYRTWTRIRVNLEAVPEGERPPQGTPDPDDAPKAWWPGAEGSEGTEGSGG
ncbi:MAG: non-homologous end-joining DNA ligase [Myxococcota bacterium]